MPGTARGSTRVESSLDNVTLAVLPSHGVATTEEVVRAPTRDRILDAAFEAVATFGLSRFTTLDVARLAGLSRQSVYRYFASKDDLIQALVAREEELLLEGVRAVHARHARLEDAMREATLFCLRTARDHPLLGRLLAMEPEVLLPYLTTRGGGVVARATEVLESLAGGRRGINTELIHRTADVSVRAIVSYALTPSEDDSEVIARELAHIMAAALEAGEEDAR
jgi:AcrR family transcriptional regulator